MSNIADSSKPVNAQVGGNQAANFCEKCGRKLIHSLVAPRGWCVNVNCGAWEKVVRWKLPQRLSKTGGKNE